MAEGGPRGQGLVLATSPASEEEGVKVNFSDITTFAKLQNTCSYKVVWNNKRLPRWLRNFDFAKDLWTEEFCDWWTSLWSSDDVTLLEDMPKLLKPLALHMYSLWYTKEHPFKNGAGKTTFVFIFSLAQYMDPNFLWSIRISTTINPLTDWCGFAGKYSRNLKEKNINGRSLSVHSPFKYV